MGRKTTIAYAVLAVAAAAGIAAWCIMRTIPLSDPSVEVYQNGELIGTYPLSEDREFTISCKSGFNIVKIADGAVSVTDADCPDKVCVRTGAVSGGAVPIVCLPHRLELRVINGSSDADAVI